MTPYSADVILRDVGPTSLWRVERAIAGVPGVISARAVVRSDAQGRPLIVGLVSAQVDARLTPEEVLEQVRRACASRDCPDQVFIAYVESHHRDRRQAA